MTSLVRKQLPNLLLIALAVASVIAVLVTSGSVTTSEREARENNLLAAYREDNLQRLVIEQKGERVVVERVAADDAGQSTWLIKEPVQEEADVIAIQKLLGTLEYATIVRRIKPEEVNRTAFGLDAPRLVFAIEMGAISYRLTLGKEAASPAGAAYMEIAGDGAPNKGVVIVSKELIGELSVTAATLRGQEMMPYLSASLERLTLEGEGGPRHFRHGDWGGWRFDGMNADRRVDREAFDRILLQFARTKAERFLDPKTAEQALSKGAKVTIVMQPKDAKKPRGEIVVGGACPDAEGVVALRRAPDPAAGCVPDSVMPALTTAADDLVDHGLFSLRKDEVESFAISLGGKRLELERTGNGFTMRAPQKGDVDLEAGNARIDSVLDIRGELVEAPNPKELGLEPPAGQVSVKAVSEQDEKVREEVVQIGNAKADGSAHVRRMQDGAVLELGREALRVLVPDATLVRSRKILEFKERELHALTIKGSGREQHLVRNASGSYELEVPKGFSYDPGLVSDLVDGLSALVTDRWVADTNDGSFGLEKPIFEVSVAIEGKAGSGPTLQTIRIGDATSGGAYASIEGTPGVFVFPKRVLELLLVPLIDRSPFVVDAANTALITLEYKGRRIVLEKQGSDFVERDKSSTLSKGRIQQIVEGLGSMRAEAAVHIGPPAPEEGLDKPELTVITESRTKGGEPKKVVHYRIGAGDAWRAISVFYGRVDGIDASFVIARSKVNQVLNAL